MLIPIPIRIHYHLVFSILLPVMAALGIAFAPPTQAADSAPQVTLSMADQKGGARALLEAAGELGNLSYKIEWHEFPSAAPLLEALNAGAVDSGLVGDAPFTYALAAGAPLRAIGAGKSDPYGTAIIALANSPLSGAASLKGKRIATGKGSIGHFVTLAALQSVGLKASDVSFKFLLPVDAKTALYGGSVDAWATWEPYTATVEVVDHAKVVVNGRGLWSGLSFQVATDKAIRTKHAALQDYVARITRAQRWANEHIDEYAAALSRIIGIPKEAARLAFQRRHTMWVPIDDSVVATHQRTADMYFTVGVLPRRLDVSAAFDRSFVRSK